MVFGIVKWESQTPLQVPKTNFKLKNWKATKLSTCFDGGTTL